MTAQVDAEQILDLAKIAWPSGIPAEESAILAGLDDHRLTVAATRLDAMLRYERDGGWKDHVGPGLSRATFFSLLRAWRQRRSLASIVPRVAPHASGSRYGSDLDRVVAEVVKGTKAQTRQALTGEVEERLSKGPAASTLAGRVNRARAERERQGLGGDDGFGRLIVVDASPAFMGTVKSGARLAAWAGFVHDVATGLTVAVAAAPDARSATLIACERAASRISELASGGGHRAGLEVYVRDGGWIELDRVGPLQVRIGRDAPRVEVRRPSARRSVGSRILNLIGHRYGPVTLKPRMALAHADRTDQTTSIAAMIDARVDAEANRIWQAKVENGFPVAVPRDDLVRSLRLLLEIEDFVSPADA